MGGGWTPGRRPLRRQQTRAAFPVRRRQRRERRNDEGIGEPIERGSG